MTEARPPPRKGLPASPWPARRPANRDAGGARGCRRKQGARGCRARSAPSKNSQQGCARAPPVPTHPKPRCRSLHNCRCASDRLAHGMTQRLPDFRARASGGKIGRQARDQRGRSWSRMDSRSCDRQSHDPMLRCSPGVRLCPSSRAKWRGVGYVMLSQVAWYRIVVSLRGSLLCARRSRGGFGQARPSSRATERSVGARAVCRGCRALRPSSRLRWSCCRGLGVPHVAACCSVSRPLF